MCIIIEIPQGKAAPSNEIFKRCWAGNSDYCGFMYVDDSGESPKIVIRKYKTFLGFLTAFHKIFPLVNPTGPFIIHFRDASAGDVSLENTHPFYISSEAAFCHNGTINSSKMDDTIKCLKMSDSRKFNDFVLKELPPKWWENKTVLDLISSFVKPSRLCILTTDKQVIKINPTEIGGHHKDGLWFSTEVPVIRDDLVIKKSPIYDPLHYYKGGYGCGPHTHTNLVPLKAKDSDLKEMKKYAFYSTCDGCGEVLMVRDFIYKNHPYQFCAGCAADPDTAASNFWNSDRAASVYGGY
jgi:hypothetical protein